MGHAGEYTVRANVLGRVASLLLPDAAPAVAAGGHDNRDAAVSQRGLGRASGASREGGHRQADAAAAQTADVGAAVARAPRPRTPTSGSASTPPLFQEGNAEDDPRAQEARPRCVGHHPNQLRSYFFESSFPSCVGWLTSRSSHQAQAY